MRIPATFAFVALVLAGCAEPGTPPVDCEGRGQSGQSAELLYFSSWMDPTQPADYLAISWNLAGDGRIEAPGLLAGPVRNREAENPVAGEPHDVGWSHRQFAPGEHSVLHSFRVQPRTDTNWVRMNWTLVEDRFACMERTPLYEFHGSTTNPWQGEIANPGQGVHVWYAGFWENGTLFGSNLPEMQFERWPRADWYAPDTSGPMPVYVYDQDRGERPPTWGNPWSGTPAMGSPVDEEAGLGYYTTIKGFNDALKGLSTSTTRVVRVAPEDAYTRPGNEDHPLYGDSLVFYIKLEAVVDVPCPQGPDSLACRLSPPWNQQPALAATFGS